MSDLTGHFKKLVSLYGEMEDMIRDGSERMVKPRLEGSPGSQGLFSGVMEKNERAVEAVEEMVRIMKRTGKISEEMMSGDERNALRECRTSFQSLSKTVEKAGKKIFGLLDDIQGELRHLESGKKSLKEYIPGRPASPLFVDVRE